MKDKFRFTIENKSEDEAEIEISGIIGWDDEGTWKNVKKQLATLVSSKIAKIVVNINSLGGLVTDGLMIHDALAQTKAEVETRVFSLTASAATVIAQAGGKRTMSSNALYLIHHGSLMAWGNVYDLATAMDDLKKIDKRIEDIYLKRGADPVKFRELFEANNGTGKWIDAEEALEAGLIDEIFEPKKAAAMASEDIAEVQAFLAKNHLPLIPSKMIDEKLTKDLKDMLDEHDREEATATAGGSTSTAEEGTESTETETATEGAEEAAQEGAEAEGEEGTTEGAEGETTEGTEGEESEGAESAEGAEGAEATELRALVQKSTETVNNLTAQIAELNKEKKKLETALAKAKAKSTIIEGKKGAEDDPADEDIPFMSEVKALDQNFLLGKPLENPKNRKKEEGKK